MELLDKIRALSAQAELLGEQPAAYEEVEAAAHELVGLLPEGDLRQQGVDAFAWGRFEEHWAEQEVTR